MFSKNSECGGDGAVGVTKDSVFTIVLQFFVVFLIVLVFLIVMLIVIGKVPITILFTVPGFFLQVILAFYFWLLLFAIPGKAKKSKKNYSS
jgi:hypothetical protein